MCASRALCRRLVGSYAEPSLLAELPRRRLVEADGELLGCVGLPRAGRQGYDQVARSYSWALSLFVFHVNYSTTTWPPRHTGNSAAQVCMYEYCIVVRVLVLAQMVGLGFCGPWRPRGPWLERARAGLSGAMIAARGGRGGPGWRAWGPAWSRREFRCCAILGIFDDGRVTRKASSLGT